MSVFLKHFSMYFLVQSRTILWLLDHPPSLLGLSSFFTTFCFVLFLFLVAIKYPLLTATLSNGGPLLMDPKSFAGSSFLLERTQASGNASSVLVKILELWGRAQIKDPIFVLTEAWLCYVTLGRSPRVCFCIYEMRMVVDDKMPGSRNAAWHKVDARCVYSTPS